MSKPASGFVISSLELQGFMRYRDDTQIAFPEKFVAITGPTGSGKSSLLDAITFALYGMSSRKDEGLKVEEFVDKNGHVRLEFYQAGRKFEVVRGRKAGRSFLALNENMKSIGGSSTEVQREITNIVGLDYLGFRNSTFIRQDEMKAIGSETGAERLDIFQRLFRLEVFEKAQKIAGERLTEARENAIRAEEEAKQKSIQYTETLPAKRKELESAKDKAKRLRALADDLARQASELRKQVRELQPAHDAYSKISEALGNLNDELEEMDVKIGRAKEKDSERMKLAEEVEALRQVAEEHERLSRERTRLEGKEQRAIAVDEKIEIHNQNITGIGDRLRENAKRLRVRLDAAKRRLDGLRTDLDKDQAFALLRLEGALRERLQRIDKEVAWLKDRRALAEQLKGERTQTEAQLPKVSNRTRSINQDIFLRTEIASSIGQIGGDIERAKDKADDDVRRERTAISRLEREKKAVGFRPAMQAGLKKVAARMAQIKNDALDYSRKRSKLEGLPDQRALLRELWRNRTRTETKRKKVVGQEEKLREPEATYTRLNGQLEEVQSQVTKAVEEAGNAEGGRDTLKTEVEQLDKLGPEVAKLRAKAEALSKDAEVYSILKEDIFHRRGVLVYAISQLLQSIGRESSFILGELTDGRLNDIRMTTYTDTRGGGVDIEVEGVDGLFHDVSVFSGGEKTQVNAALRFAIAKELASMPQVGKSYGNMKTLFIDEGDLGSLDTEQSRKLFVRKLFTLGDLFEKVILITHITDVAEQFPYRIRVYMTPEQYSKVAEVVSQ